jgi:L-ascorbate metabolism protein UlaG (beta-lactamase superfamily)
LTRAEHTGAHVRAKAGGGSVAVTWVGHATVLIELGGLRILTDPVVGRRASLLRRVVPPPRPDVLENIDLVLVSHAHSDHLDPRSLRRLRPACPVLAPPAAARLLHRRAGIAAQVVSAGSSMQVGGVTVDVVHAEHDGRRWPRGPSAAAVGYVVSAGASAYFAGDTDLHPELSALNRGVDVALLPVWGWGPTVGEGHLTPDRAAQALATIAPRVAVPIHWGTLSLPWARASHDERHLPPLAFAEAAARLAPDVHVRVLGPGERTTVHSARVVPAGDR